METLARYIHGSEDSTDVDVIYIVDALPEFKECKQFCDADREHENRNLAVIKNGVVTEVYKGSPDEVNNALLATYPLHKQEYPLLIEHPVERNIYIKTIRSLRMILSHLSRTQHRTQIKCALRSNWATRLLTLNTIVNDWPNIIINDKNHQMKSKDILKVIAFQIGQTRALVEDGEELYTKYKISLKYPYLRPFLYREDLRCEPYTLGLELELYKYNNMLQYDKRVLTDFNIEGTSEEPLVKFQRDNTIYNLLTEKPV